MVKYKVNLKFKDVSVSLNEIITKALKIELANMFNMTCNSLDRELPSDSTYNFGGEGSIN